MRHDQPASPPGLSDHPTDRPQRVEDAVAQLARASTIELTAKEVVRIGSLGDFLAPGTGVYLTAIPGAPVEQTFEAAARIAGAGLRPVPHLAARSFPALADVDSYVGTMVGTAGVDEVLVVAGSLPEPAGEIESTQQILRSGLLEKHGIRRVGIAGHPEGHPDVKPEALAAAIAEKNAFAAESSLDVYIVTQFAFSAEAYVRWEREIRAAGNRLPVHPGLPGVTSTRKLIRFAISCGVGASLRVLRKQARGITLLASRGVYRPDAIVAGIAQALVADPGALFRTLHFFPFGGFEDTVRWLDDVRSGRARLRA